MTRPARPFCRRAVRAAGRCAVLGCVRYWGVRRTGRWCAYGGAPRRLVPGRGRLQRLGGSEAATGALAWRWAPPGVGAAAMRAGCRAVGWPGAAGQSCPSPCDGTSIVPFTHHSTRDACPIHASSRCRGRRCGGTFAGSTPAPMSSTPRCCWRTRRHWASSRSTTWSSHSWSSWSWRPSACTPSWVGPPGRRCAYLERLRTEHGTLTEPIVVNDARRHRPGRAQPHRHLQPAGRVLVVGERPPDPGRRPQPGRQGPGRHAGQQGPAAAAQGVGGRPRGRGVPQRAGRRATTAGPGLVELDVERRR